MTIKNKIQQAGRNVQAAMLNCYDDAAPALRHAYNNLPAAASAITAKMRQVKKAAVAKATATMTPVLKAAVAKADRCIDQLVDAYRRLAFRI